MRPRFGWIIVAVLVAGRAQARDDAAKDAQANALWAEGRSLMAAGETAKACTKFEASLAIVPKLGTRLNLANCYEVLGRAASAWSTFRAGMEQARAAGDRREEYARARAAALEPRVSRLIVEDGTGGIRDLEVTRNGDVVPAAILGQLVPVDPGEQTVTAAAPGHKPWQTRATVGTEARTVTVRIPPLEKLPGAAVALPPPATTRVAAGDPGRTRRLIAYGVGGAGVASMIVGTIVVLSAKSDWDASRSDCDEQNRCGDVGFEQASNARSKATVSTVLYGVGIAAVATGVVLWLTAPSAEAGGAEHARWQLAPTLAPTGAGLSVTRGF